MYAVVWTLERSATGSSRQAQIGLHESGYGILRVVRPSERSTLSSSRSVEWSTAVPSSRSSRGTASMSATSQPSSSPR